MIVLALLLTLLAASPEPLKPGDHTRTLEVDRRTRSYLVHIPKSYESISGTELSSVEHSLRACVKANGCKEEPATVEIPDKAKDGTKSKSPGSYDTRHCSSTSRFFRHFGQK